MEVPIKLEITGSLSCERHGKGKRVFRRSYSPKNMNRLFAIVCMGIIASFPISAVSNGGQSASSTDRRMVYSWRVYSERLDYARGGHTVGGYGTVTTRELSLRADGTWMFGSSHNTWSVQPITPDDWKRWNIKAYGPTHKIVLHGWSGQDAEGPIEASKKLTGWVDFFWLIYHTDKPEAGTMSMRFGHVNQDLR